VQPALQLAVGAGHKLGVTDTGLPVGVHLDVVCHPVAGKVNGKTGCKGSPVGMPHDEDWLGVKKLALNEV
jgi:hypothetical protein